MRLNAFQNLFRDNFNLNKFFIITFLIYVISSLPIHSIRYPITPYEPSSPKIGLTKENSLDTTSAKNKITRNKIHIKAVLGSGDELNGFIMGPKKIKFKHYRNGFVYQKTITLNNILFIEIIYFQQNLIRRKGTHSLYEFKPSRIKIQMKDKNHFELNYLFTFLHQFEIKTTNGTTTLHSFFADEFHKTKGWSEVESIKDDYHRYNPHPKSVKKILFFEEMNQK